VSTPPDRNLEEIRRYVLEEIASYRYEVDQAATGKPPSDEWVARQIAALRAALVEPEWRVVQKRDAPAESARETPELRHCVLIAVDRDPDGYAELYFDPYEEDFVVASGDPPQTFGVRGDAVGCFMAR
jgi:hypothetical protein